MNILAQIVSTHSSSADDVLVAQNVFFAILAVVMIYSSVRLVTTSNVVHAAFYLVLVLAGVAGIFILLGAEFIGVTQIMVYIGAVVVLLLFGVMLTRGGTLDTERNPFHTHRLTGFLVSCLLLLVVGSTLVSTFTDVMISRSHPSTTASIGDSIFSQYIVPFEAVSVLLLAALIGSVVIARRD